MNKFLDLNNKRFGKLIAIKPTGKDKNNRYIWLCKCDCGNFIKVKSGNLISKHSKSCGCLLKKLGNQHPSWKGYGQISSKYWSSIKQHAKSRNLEFSITIEYSWNLFLKQDKKCSLSGQYITLCDSYFKSSQNHNLHTASLDRINSIKGYLPDNIQWIHKDIQKMKWAYDQEYFISICKKISNHTNTKEKNEK